MRQLAGLAVLGTGIVSAAGDMKDFTLNERKKLVLESVGSEPLSEAAIKESTGGTNTGLTSKRSEHSHQPRYLTSKFGNCEGPCARLREGSKIEVEARGSAGAQHPKIWITIQKE